MDPRRPVCRPAARALLRPRAREDHDAVIAAFTMPHHDGRTEGVNTRTKMLKRQMYGRAGFTLLRHRILLG